MREMGKGLTPQRRASLALKSAEEVKSDSEPATENRSLFSVDHCRGFGGYWFTLN